MAALDRSRPYFTVTVGMRTDDPYNPKFAHYNFTDYYSAHGFAVAALASPSVIQCVGRERRDGRTQVTRFVMGEQLPEGYQQYPQLTR